MVIFLNFFFRMPWSLAIIVQVLVSILLGLTEGISVPLLAWIFSYKLEDIIPDPLLRIVFTLPHLVLLAAVTCVAARREWRLPLLENMIMLGKDSNKRLIGRSYLFIICLVQALMLVLLNISFYIYAADVYPSFTLATMVTTSSIVIITSALATVFVAGYSLKLAEREARLETKLLHNIEMHNLNLKMQVQRHDFYNTLRQFTGT